MNIKVYMDALDFAEEEMKKVLKKENMTPQELCTLKDCMSIAEKALNVIGDLPSNEQSRAMSPNGYSNNSWNPVPGYKHYFDHMENDTSYERGRSPVTGRYVSRDMDRGYSSHSVEDRMVAALEKMMDKTESDYERQTIRDEIRSIKDKRN